MRYNFGSNISTAREPAFLQIQFILICSGLQVCYMYVIVHFANVLHTLQSKSACILSKA